jgi:hypothetical protein
LNLGKIFISKIEDDKLYEDLILDKDFKGRTIFKIITDNGFEPLMSEKDQNSENFLLKLWNGQESS